MAWPNRGLAHRPAVTGRHGAIASAHPLASLAGLTALQQGGNAFVAAVGGGLFNVVAVLAVANWVAFARLIRGSVLSSKAQEYVIAARAIGVRDYSLLFKHILPNVITPVIVYATFGVAAAIIAEAGLSFLGLGVGSTVSDWGAMLPDGRQYVGTAWWLATIPGVAIMLTVLSINMIGDWIRDALDPHLRNI